MPFFFFCLKSKTASYSPCYAFFLPQLKDCLLQSFLCLFFALTSAVTMKFQEINKKENKLTQYKVTLMSLQNIKLIFLLQLSKSLMLIAADTVHLHFSLFLIFSLHSVTPKCFISSSMCLSICVFVYLLVLYPSSLVHTESSFVCSLLHGPASMVYSVSSHL